MPGAAPRAVGLVVTGDPTLAGCLVHELRALGWIAVAVDDSAIAQEMMEIVDVALVIVDVARTADWLACRRLVAAQRSPVAIVTRFLAADRRYRRFAFGIGVAAYACQPCRRGRLREMIRRLQAGERRLELVAGAPQLLADGADVA